MSGALPVLLAGSLFSGPISVLLRRTIKFVQEYVFPVQSSAPFIARYSQLWTWPSLLSRSCSPCQESMMDIYTGGPFALGDAKSPSQ